jgi:hypothetical protein
MLRLPVPDTVERYDPDDAMVGLTAFSLPELATCGEIEDYSPFYLTKPFPHLQLSFVDHGKTILKGQLSGGHLSHRSVISTNW